MYFADNAGYAILAADKRLGSQVIAIVDEGLPDVSLYGENIFAAEADRKTPEQYMAGHIMDYAIRAIVDPSLVDDPNSDFSVETKSQSAFIYETRPALVKTKWNQGAPFNQTSLENEPQGDWVGCGPVAVGQLYVYYKGGEQWYAEPNEVIFLNWQGGMYFTLHALQRVWSHYYPFAPPSEGTDIYKWVCANYLYYVGKCMNAFYRSTGTSTTWSNTKRFFTSHDFKTLAESNKFDFNFIKQYVGRGYAMIARGENSAGEGHAWVVDGYMHIQTSTQPVALMLVHCNWGWGGSGDGYYDYRVLNTYSQGPEEIDYDCGDNDFGGYYGADDFIKNFKLYVPKPKFDSPANLYD